MSLPLVFRPEVREEMDEAFAWYERRRIGLGEEFLAAVHSTLDRIQEIPEHYGVVHRDVRAALVRRFPYVVYYLPEPRRIVIIAIQHGRRDPRSWQSKI